MASARASRRSRFGASKEPMHKGAMPLLYAVLTCAVAPAWAVDNVRLQDTGEDPASPYTLVLPAPERYLLKPLPGAQRSNSAGPTAVQPHSDRTYRPRPFNAEVEAAAFAAGIDPALVHAVIDVESAYNPLALSSKGAVGLMQVMPTTGKRYGVTNLFDPPANLHAGAGHLSDLLRMFDGQLTLALAAYNAGEGAVLKYGRRMPPYPETVQYVPRVIKRYRALTEDGRSEMTVMP
jgi:soluble lytic murein transglycosylase-like protein